MVCVHRNHSLLKAHREAHILFLLQTFLSHSQTLLANVTFLQDKVSLCFVKHGVSLTTPLTSLFV